MTEKCLNQPNINGHGGHGGHGGKHSSYLHFKQPGTIKRPFFGQQGNKMPRKPRKNADSKMLVKTYKGRSCN